MIGAQLRILIDEHKRRGGGDQLRRWLRSYSAARAAARTAGVPFSFGEWWAGVAR